MKERPILFTNPMVRAILDGTKTQTRRALRQQPTLHTDAWEFSPSGGWIGTGPSPATGSPRQTLCWTKCPYGQPGDRLWVREAYRLRRYSLNGVPMDGVAPRLFCDSTRWFDADGAAPDLFGKMRHARFMPRWASRILLEVVSVRVERLRDISVEDIEAEGVKTSDEAIKEHGCRARVLDYQRLWESINGAGGWDANPWVWVVEFKRVTP